MGPLASVCLVVLLTVPTLQDRTASPRTLTSPVQETPTPLPASRHNTTTSSENSFHAPTLTKKGKSHNGSEICGNITSEMPCSIVNHHNYNININENNSCTFSCYYNPSQLQPLRLEVHQHYRDPVDSPTFVSVQQDRYISSWTLPFTTPARGQDQIFTSLETLLCPPANDTKEIVQVSISARGLDNKALQIALTNVSFVLQKDVNVSVTVTPVSSWYKRYQWGKSEESVLVTAESVQGKSVDTCALLVLQNAKCPVSSDVSGLMNKGRYQTFTKAAGMVARRTDFPNGVHVIVISLPDDDACMLNTAETQHDKKRDTRTKTIVLEVYDHATIASTWYIFLMTAIVLTVITVAASTLICFLTNRTLTASGEKDDESVCDENNDERPLIRGRGNGPSFRVMAECGVASMGGRQQAQHNNPSGMGNNLLHNNMGQGREGLDEAAEEDGVRGDGGRDLLAIEAPVAAAGRDRPHDNQGALVAQPPPYLPATTYAPEGQAVNVTESFNPQFVWWWKNVAVYEAGTAEAQVSEVGIQNSMVIMGVFAALPYSELLRSYLGLVLHHGQEDQCFWNSRCLTAFGVLPDFARVFTNLGYILLGVAYVLIVRRHKTLMHDIRENARNSVGVSHHYGLFVSLGYGLVMQGVMSAFYHTCPNSVTIKFDMMFMYVIMVVAVVSMWGLRHGDITHHVYPTLIAVGLALLVAEGRMWMSREWFWGLLATAYVILLASNTVLMASCGIWSFSLPQLWHVWSGWKQVRENLRNVLGEQDTSHRPMQVVRVMVGVFANISLIVFGIVEDPNVYNFVLIVCLVNMGLYFANYVLVKRLSFQEKGTVLAWTCLALSSVLWIIALVFFYHHNTDSESSPAASRAENSSCDVLYVFDEHDVWHVSSSFALFFFFVALLTMDDDLCRKPSKDIFVT